MALSRRTGQRFQNSIWPGFVDAMTGLLLVLMFVLTIFMVVQFTLRETITGQESELNQLSNEIAALAQALGLEREKTAELQSEVGNLVSTLVDANTRAREQAALIAGLQQDVTERDAALSQAGQRIATLEQTVAEREDALGAANARIASFEDRVAGLLADQETATARIAELEDSEQALLSEQEALQLALAQARDEIDAEVEAARLAAAQADALEAMIADLKAQQEESSAEFSSQVSALEDRLSEEEARRLAEAAAAEALREKLMTADAELSAMTLALEEQRREAEETLSMLAAAQAAEQDLDARLAAALGGVDVVVSDVMMPEMNGPALVEALREIVPDAAVLFVSGYADADLRETIELKSRHFLRKPFHPDELCAAVREALRLKSESTEILSQRIPAENGT